MVGEGAEICGERSSLEGAQGRREDAHELDEELLVVARDVGPPWVYVGRDVGEGYEVVELRVQRWAGRGVRWARKVRGGGRGGGGMAWLGCWRTK